MVINSYYQLNKNMKKNKKVLTKEQKEKKKAKIEKFKLIGLIISILLNAFFITMCSVGCASDNGNKVVAAQTIESDLYDKNLAYTNSVNADSIGFYLTQNNVKYKPSAIIEDYYQDYYVSLGAETSVVVRNNNTGTLVAMDSTIHVQFRINASNINNSLIWIEWGDGSVNSLVADSQSNSWVAWNIDTQQSEPLLNREIYLPLSLGYNAENYERFKNDLKKWFNIVDYYDINLSNWSPYAFLQNSFVINGATSGATTIIQDCLMSINGTLYNKIYYFLNVGPVPLYYSETNIVDLESNQGYIAFVTAVNTLNNKTLTLMDCEYKAVTRNGGTQLAVVDSSLRFVNNNLSEVRLWTTYADEVSVYSNNYTNYTLLTATFNGFTSSVGTSGSFGDVFGLFGIAFSGLGSLFSISIFPGLTIGALVFLPLIAIIIFALIKIIKK